MYNEIGMSIPWRMSDERFYSADDVRPQKYRHSRSRDMDHHSQTYFSGRSSSFGSGVNRSFKGWERTAPDEFCGVEERMSSTNSTRRSRNSFLPNSLVRNSLMTNMPFEENDDVDPWDSVSMTSSLRHTIQENRETFDDGYSTPRNWMTAEPEEEDWNGTSSPLRQPREASARLMSCMDSLDYLSKKLESVTKLSSEVEKYRKVSENTFSNSLHRTNNIPSSTDSQRRVRNISERYRDESQNHNSCDSSSTDSGINVEARKFPTFPRHGSNSERQFRPLPRTPHESQFDSNKFHQLGHSLGKNHYTSSSRNSRKNNFCSLSNYCPPAFVEEDQHQNGADKEMYNERDYLPQETLVYDYDGIYGCENPYEYGTFPYASSSVYDEDLHQNNGWFYLPNHGCANFQGNTETSNLHNPLQTSQNYHFSNYKNALLSSSGTLPPITAHQHPLKASSSYGTLSGSFLNPSSQSSLFVDALSATCATDSMYDVLPTQFPNLSISAERYIDGEAQQTTPDQYMGENKKRKSVRFSEMVRERVEKDGSEVEDKTSFIKGEEKKRETSSTTSYAKSTSQSNESDVYDYPSNHPIGCVCPQCAQQNCPALLSCS